MSVARWYPTQVALANGATLILGGLDRECVHTPVMEVMTPAGEVRVVEGGERFVELYPRLHLLTSGDVARKTITGGSGVPAASRPATAGSTPKAQNGDATPRRMAPAYPQNPLRSKYGTTRISSREVVSSAAMSTANRKTQRKRVANEIYIDPNNCNSVQRAVTVSSSQHDRSRVFSSLLPPLPLHHPGRTVASAPGT